MHHELKCLICGGDCAPDPLYSIKDHLGIDTAIYEVFSCKSCESIRICPVPDDKEIERLYSNSYNFKSKPKANIILKIIRHFEYKFYYQPYFEGSCQLVRRSVGKEHFSVFDIGCGSGDRLEVFKKDGCEIEGNDISNYCAEYASDNLGVKVYHGKLENLKIEGKYDVVTMYNLFEHLTEPSMTVTAASKILKDNGILLIEVPVVDSLVYKLLEKKSPMVRDMPRHISIPSIKGLNALMSSNGFALVSKRTVSILISAGLFTLGIFPQSTTSVAYSKKTIGLLFSRAIGWLLTVLAGIPFGMAEKAYGASGSMIFIYRKQ